MSRCEGLSANQGYVGCTTSKVSYLRYHTRVNSQHKEDRNHTEHIHSFIFSLCDMFILADCPQQFSFTLVRVAVKC